jgi:hypothetical protein
VGFEARALLRRKNEEQGALIESEVNQAPISVADFKAEVLCAHQLLTLYTEIRKEDLEALEARVYGTDSKRHRASYWPHTPTTDLEHYFVHRRKAARLGRLAWFLKEKLLGPDESEWNDVGRWTVWTALTALQEIVKTRIAEVRLAFDMRWTGSQPLGSDYRIPRSWDCPDLLSMMYLQFYLLITDFEPMRYCDNPACGMPFPATPKNKRFCNATCRSNARHYR